MNYSDISSEKEIKFIHGKDIHIEKKWCENMNQYYGDPHPKYGGRLVDLRTLPIGTIVYIMNGCWDGIISQNKAGEKTIIVDVPKTIPNHIWENPEYEECTHIITEENCHYWIE